MTVDTVLARAADVLGGLPGFAGLALGGSHARGAADEHSDVDLGLYYTAPAPVEELLAAFRRLDDRGEPDGWAAYGGWGPWIDGGAWLRVDGHRVDLLLRDAGRVREVVAECVAGRPGIHYQAGHPHGFCTVIWAGEVHHNRPVADPDGVLADLRSLTEPYPAALRDALVERFGWEAGFALETAGSAAARGDVTHVAGCAYRAVACLNQVLFALHGAYLVNEKGATPAADRFPGAPAGYRQRVEAALRTLDLDALRALRADVLG